MPPPTGSSTRWCPTPQQLMMLDEMYRSGIRTPNATQIQQITSQLSLYGKIEGKNVFYWFQNHKARDRQKLRKKLTKQLQHQQQLYQHHQQQLLHYLGGGSPAPPFRHLPYNNSAALPNLLPQAPPHDEAGAKQVMNYTWKFGVPEPEGVEKNKGMMRMYGSDWLMMVDLGAPPPSPPCYSMISRQPPPLKTLELFPLTSSNFKEDCNRTDSSDSVSSVSCNITPANVPLSLA